MLTYGDQRQALRGWFCAGLILLSGRQTVLAEDITLDRWQAVYPYDELHRFPADQQIGGMGYIADQETWEAVWGPIPFIPARDIDFTNEIVVYVRNEPYHGIINSYIGPLHVSLDDQGIVDITAWYTAD